MDYFEARHTINLNLGIVYILIFYVSVFGVAEASFLHTKQGLHDGVTHCFSGQNGDIRNGSFSLNFQG